MVSKGFSHRLVAIWLSALLCASAVANDSLHEPWGQLLKKHVTAINNGHSTVVDYMGFSRDRASLNGYLAALSAVSADEYASWSKERQLAFLINAYNSFTVALILTDYPQLESIRDLGSWLSSPWKKDFINLLGDTVSLDDIEHGMIRDPAVFDEPRIHFAVNCASVGCPALREEAYSETNIDAQLEQQTTRFLTDTTRNYHDGDTVFLSSIFKWYDEDFTPTFWLNYGQLLGLPPAEQQALAAGDYPVRYLDYDWSLNDTN